MPPHAPDSNPQARPILRRAALAALALVACLAFVPQGAAQTGCSEEGYNMQCNEFGTIKMENQRDIRGKPIEIEATATVHDTFADRGARYILFSIRHEPRGDSSPVSLQLLEFKSRYGDVVTTRVETEVPNEVNAWVHVVDVPTDTPITMKVKVGSTDRGAFQLESLVMPFDRGYEPITDASGQDLSLFAYTILGVNGETGKLGGGGSFIDGIRTPGPALPLLAGGLFAAVLFARRRVL